MNDEVKQIMSDVMRHKGEKFLVLCCVEEMQELSKELLKNINRGRDNIADIAEELADVIVYLEHVKNTYGISDEQIDEIINKKMPKKWSNKIKKWKGCETNENQRIW